MIWSNRKLKALFGWTATTILAVLSTIPITGLEMIKTAEAQRRPPSLDGQNLSLSITILQILDQLSTQEVLYRAVLQVQTHAGSPTKTGGANPTMTDQLGI